MENDVVQNREMLHRQTMTESGIVYSLSAVLPVLLSFLVSAIAVSVAGENYADSDGYKYLSYLLPQICFAASAVVYFSRTKQPLKKIYCGCKWYDFLIAIVLQFGLMFSLTYLNTWFIKFLELFGYKQSESALPNLSGWHLLPALAVIALLPAIFEETIFRGILSPNMHAVGWGNAATVLISGAMFSLFHGNPEQTLYQFVCGMCFTLVSLRAGSVLPTMVAHFFNNALILVLTSLGYGDGLGLSAGSTVALYVVSGLCLAGTLIYLVFFDRRNAQKGGVKAGKAFFLAAAVGLLVCGVEWIAVLVEGIVGG